MLGFFLLRQQMNFNSYIPSALEDHEKSDLDPDQDHLPKSDLRSRSDPDLTWKYDLQIVI